MKLRYLYLTVALSTAVLEVRAQSIAAAERLPARWALDGEQNIIWSVAADKHLPHSDHVEMSGRNASVIVTYAVDREKRIQFQTQVIWPSYIVKYDYRGYLTRNYDRGADPAFWLDEKPLETPRVTAVGFDGTLWVQYEAERVSIKRHLFCATRQAAMVDEWEITNTAQKPVVIRCAAIHEWETQPGEGGSYLVNSDARGEAGPLAPRETRIFWVAHTARPAGMPPLSIDGIAELQLRRDLVAKLGEHLKLKTPDPLIDQEFRFAKLRAAESLFATPMGLVHSPGGGRYYGGVWANDQLEYTHPFFAYLGYDAADEAAMNGYKQFMPYMTPDYRHIPCSLEMGGRMQINSRDRGDAAMYACGASLYALTTGDRATARSLWPAIQWCLEYCNRRTNSEGVVESDTDEMEGRVPTGTANLSTSTLTYGALVNAGYLARALGEEDELAEKYGRRAAQLRSAIERYFGAEVDGYHTYRYFAGHAKLRHWICLPLVMGIDERRSGTTRALFEQLWTPDGLLVEKGLDLFWDRATLFALRAGFSGGSGTEALVKLEDYTRRRLIGEHVPYPVEAYPEGDQAHLAAEGALYCRIIIEGMFGVRPVGFREFECTPNLPGKWGEMSLNDIYAFGTRFSIVVTRTDPEHIAVKIFRDDAVVFSATGPTHSAFKIRL